MTLGLFLKVGQFTKSQQILDTMKKPSRPNYGWSKTKQMARKMVLTAEQRRKEDRREAQLEAAQERFKQREIANAKKLLGDSATVRKSERAAVARVPAEGMVFFH
jgi:hypothetical protein